MALPLADILKKGAPLNTVQPTAGMGLTLDSNGRLPESLLYATGSFSAYKSSDQTGIVTATYTKVTFDTEEWDNGNWFASSTFSPTLPGIYRLGAAVSPGPTALADGIRIILTLYKNGTEFRVLASERLAANGDDHTYSGTTLVENDGNDTFEVYFRHNAGANRDLRGGQALTWFQGEYIGRKT